MKKQLLISTALLTLCATATAESLSEVSGNLLRTDNEPLIWGTMAGSKFWTSDQDREADLGLYNFYATDKVALNPVVKGADFSWESAMYVNGKVYAMTNDMEDGYPSGNRYLAFDADNGLLTFNSYSADVPKLTESRIISPAIQLAAGKEQYLSFALYHYSGTFTTNDKIAVEVVKADGSVESMGEISREAAENGWKQYSFNLNKYAGEKAIAIAFKGVSDYGYNIHIDKVEINETSGVESVENGNIQVSAANGTVYVTATEEVTARIYNTLGQLIAEKEGTEMQFNLQSGIYIIQSKNFIKKVTVR